MGLALVHSFGTASATPLYLRRWIVPLLLNHTDIPSVLHNKSAPRDNLYDSTPFWLSIVTEPFTTHRPPRWR